MSLPSEDPVKFRIRIERPLDERPSYYWVTERLELMVFRAGGRLRVFSSICPHMGAQIQHSARRCALKCPWHGLELDLETGQTGHPRYPRLREWQAQLEGDELIVTG